MDLRYHAREAAQAVATRTRVRAAGVTCRGAPLWTKQEDDKVRTLYPDYQAIKTAIKRRSLAAVYIRARYLGVATSHRYWTAAEISRMRRIYPSATSEELLEAFPRRSMGQIYDCAARYNVKRKREPHSTAGYPIIEQIILRAKKCNLSMKDLDAMARTTPYFASGRWRFDGLNRRSVYRAIEALDGEVTIAWR